MDEKISIKALEDYSDDYASKLTASFFAAKDKISGPEILTLSDIQQINLFVIRELLNAWKLESQKLHSPYFDSTAPPVAEALTHFHNLLSNHIAISRENFQPLLKKAVSRTLSLVLNPYDFYAEIIGRQGSSLKVDDLRNEVKYIRINRTPMERLMSQFEGNKQTTIAGNEAFAALDHILEEVAFTPEDVDDHLSRFSSVVPVALEDLYERSGGARPEEKTTATAAPIQSPEVVAPQKPTPVLPSQPPNEPAKPEPPVKAELPTKQETKKAQTQIPLYDQQPGKGTTLAENFQKRKKIKDSLTINQKFMFTKILFNGDFELFSAAVDRLDELDNLSQAKSYLSNNYGEWNPESEEFQEFMEMVERRFA